VPEPPANPLSSSDPRDWEQLIESLGPASLLAAIEGRMSAELLARHSAEDVLQETLLHLWRDRAKIEWRGAKSFRSLVLSMAIHRIQDASDAAAAAKRGGGLALISLDGPGDTQSGDGRHDVALSTTPSRVAMHRERAEVMRRALEGLPADLRAVVALRTLEQKTLNEIAAELDLGLNAVRHRLRIGVSLYAQRLRLAFDTSAVAPDSSTDRRADPSS
jgi:RNA polymerase sigma factor (sigma-70 family)